MKCQFKCGTNGHFWRNTQLGINDPDFTTWYNNFVIFKAAFEAKGAEVIPITLFPRVGKEAMCSQVTNYVLTHGGRYIDFAKAMTIGGDRATRDDALFIADKLHPTVAGHAKMFAQAKCDLPDLIIS